MRDVHVYSFVFDSPPSSRIAHTKRNTTWDDDVDVPKALELPMKLIHATVPVDIRCRGKA